MSKAGAKDSVMTFFSDCLATAKGTKSVPVKPIFSNRTRSRPNDTTPIAYISKIAHLNEDLTMIFAGNLSQIKLLTKEIENLQNEYGSNVDAQKALQISENLALKEENWNNNILFINQDRENSDFEFTCQNCFFQDRGDHVVVSGGSGVAFFSQPIENWAGDSHMVAYENWASPDESVSKTVDEVLQKLVLSTSAELHSPKFDEYYFGGFYEHLHLGPSGLIKSPICLYKIVMNVDGNQLISTEVSRIVTQGIGNRQSVVVEADPAEVFGILMNPEPVETLIENPLSLKLDIYKDHPILINPAEAKIHILVFYEMGKYPNVVCTGRAPVDWDLYKKTLDNFLRENDLKSKPEVPILLPRDGINSMIIRYVNATLESDPNLSEDEKKGLMLFE